jgi:two-component system response regulator NreC
MCPWENGMRIDGARILLVDDHAVVRSSLALLLKQHGAVIVGEAGDGLQAVALALELRPEVILMDISLPGQDGIAATREITQAWPEAPILALTMHAEQDYLAPFFNAGGLGFIRKAAADQDVLAAIQSVRSGREFLGETGLQVLLQSYRAPAAAEPGPETLSQREREVLEWTARGFSSREIAAQLGVSPSTVETYRGRLMEKLGLEQRHELVEYAIRHRILK